MKKKSLMFVIVVAMLALSACGTTSTTATQAASAASGGSAATDSAATASLSTSYTDAVSVKLQLLYGLLKLEDTDLALSTDQATSLLPLLQQLQPAGGPGQGQGQMPQDPATSTDASSTPSAPQAPGNMTTLTTEEEDAIITQAMAVLTSEQIQAITDMQVTQTLIDTYISDAGLSIGGGQQGNGGGPGSQSGDAAQPPQGQPGSDGSMPANSSQMATPDASQMPDMSSNLLVNAVVSLLQQKTGAVS